MYNVSDGREAGVAQTISSKGWIVIPADLRKKYGLKPGDGVHVVDYGGVLMLVPELKDPIKEGLGLLAGGPSLTQDLLEERRRDLEAEERKFATFAGDEAR
jgi:AbrB family looped-hinge helix DNA binding protein